MKGRGIGVDIANIAKFRKVAADKKSRFIANTFSKVEQEYCFSYRDPAPHLAGTFAAKEAVRKISSQFHIPFNELEVRREASGQPMLWIRGRQAKGVYISITHASGVACAVAFKD